MLSAGFYLSPLEGTKKVAWRDLLVAMLRKERLELTILTKLELKA
jgi:hypothetical protein